MELGKLVEEYIKDLIELGKKIGAWENEELEEDPLPGFMDSVLEINRYQSLTDKGWETQYFELTLAVGGPAVWVRTDYIIEASWSPDHVRKTIEDYYAKKALNAIHDYLSELE